VSLFLKRPTFFVYHSGICFSPFPHSFFTPLSQFLVLFFVPPPQRHLADLVPGGHPHRFFVSVLFFPLSVFNPPAPLRRDQFPFSLRFLPRYLLFVFSFRSDYIPFFPSVRYAIRGVELLLPIPPSSEYVLRKTTRPVQL